MNNKIGWMQITLACIFIALLPGMFLLGRSFIKGLIFAALLGWWRTLQPTNDKEWAVEVARVAHGENYFFRIPRKDLSRYEK